MTQLSAETYIPGFQARDQNTAFDDTRKSLFDAFGDLRDEPAVEGFSPDDLAKYFVRHSAQMQAQKAVRMEQAQVQAPCRERCAEAYIRANRLFLVRKKIK